MIPRIVLFMHYPIRPQIAPVLLVGLFEDLLSPFWKGRQLVILEFPKITDWSLCWVIESDVHISTNPFVSTPQT